MDLGLLKQVDYNLYSNKERAEHIQKLITPETDEKIRDYLDEHLLTDNNQVAKQLEGLANYILYGKDPDTDRNAVEDKQVEIQSKFNSYQRKAPESLEQLLENPIFNERELKPVARNVYTKPKQKIIRPQFTEDGICTNEGLHDGDIPGMQDLWESIDRIQYMLDVNTGKLPPDDSIIELDSLQIYKMKHILIDIRRHQFYLKDSYKPQIPTINSTFSLPGRIDWESDAKYTDQVQVYEQMEVRGGLESSPPLFVFKHGFRIEQVEHIIRVHTLDLTNAKHIYELLEHYAALLEANYDDFEGQMRYILYSLDEIVEATELAAPRKQILLRKVDKWTNQRIRDELQELYGLNYSANYISTIWKQEICGKIAFTAQLMYDKWLARDDKTKWKKCTCCGEKKLRDPREFIKKNTSRDGLSNRCKKCDKKLRDAAKANHRE